MAPSADSSRKFFNKSADANTALTPDYANFDGSPVIMQRNKYAGEFSFDAWRTESNWSVDWVWFKKAPIEQVLSNRIQAFFASKGMDTYGCVFSLDGRQQLDDRGRKNSRRDAERRGNEQQGHGNWLEDRWPNRRGSTA